LSLSLPWNHSRRKPFTPPSAAAFWALLLFRGFLVLVAAVERRRLAADFALLRPRVGRERDRALGRALLLLRTRDTERGFWVVLLRVAGAS